MENKTFPKVAFGSENLKLNLGTIQLSCFILDDGQRIFSKESIQKSMGYHGKSEDWLYEFLIHINRLMMVDPLLIEALSKNIEFEIKSQNGHFIKKHGVAPLQLINACNAIIKANHEGFLYLSELKFAKAAEMIIKSTAGYDIGKLIDLACGYELFKQNYKDALFRFMIEKFSGQQFVWVKTFPDAFFEIIFKTKNWDWADLNENADEVGNYIFELVFSRIHPILTEKLQQGKPKMQYRKKNSAAQYIEHPELMAHLHSISALISAAKGNLAIFQQLLNNSLPKFDHRNFLPNKTEEMQNDLSEFNEKLKKALASKI